MEQVNAEMYLQLPGPRAWLREDSSDGEDALWKPGAEQSSSGVLQQSGPGVQMGNTRDVNGFRSGRAFRPEVG